jgi:hypothetical protein
VLELRESSVISLTTRAQNITHTAANEGVLVKGKALWKAVPATHAQTGVANIPSRFDLLQKWTALRHEYTLLIGWCLSGAVQRDLHVLTRALSTSELEVTQNRRSRDPCGDEQHLI